MCDLIDLNSPNVKGAREPAKLASPLIPTPKGVEGGDGVAATESATEKREGNNPFDRVLHETAEYVSKKGDPFEVMLQRALKSKGSRNARSVDFTDDYTPRKRKYLKAMNKTLGMLDDSLLEGGFGLFDGDKRETTVKAGNVGDSNEVDDASVSKQEHKASVAGSDSLELSILNQSAMNDTLLDQEVPSKDDKASLSLERDALFKERFFPAHVNCLKLPNIQRSLSQGAGKSPTELPCLYRRSQSVTEDQRKASLTSSGSSTMSFLDRGFLETRQSDQSIFSSLSNVSSITKLTSASSSSVLSIDPMNHAFLDDGSLKTCQGKMRETESSSDVKPRPYDLVDLAERINKLKCTMNGTIPSAAEDDNGSIKGESNQARNNKLIDVDVFVPERNIEFNRSSSSTCSSDSVFTNNKIDKSILIEAKTLAKTFEELALNSGSSIEDDLISNNTLWMSELLPAFDDEPVVSDLIQLPASPERDTRDVRNNDKKQSANVDSAKGNSLKEMELPFTGVSAVKQDVTLLLSDLRKLVKSESNSEAKKLLDNLENILSINYKNNTELLVTCLNASNKSPSSQKTPSDSIERFDKSSTDKSKEESGKVSSQEKICNNEKSPSDINYKKLEGTSQDRSQDVSVEKSSVTSSPCKDNSEGRTRITDSSDLTEDSKHKEYKAKENDSQEDKKIAIELLINLQKLLSGQSEDDTTIQLLKNIGKVLNTALNNNPEREMQANCARKQNIQQITPVRARRSDAHSSSLSAKVANRRSLEPKSKAVRRSISAIESSPKSTQTHRRRDTSELANRQKRFSSDPGFSNNASNKKLIETCNTRKAEAVKPDNGKEKSIGISDVKNKLKKRSDVVNKRGPLKAVHPVDNMQRKRASISGRQASTQIVTPPKSDKIAPSGNKIISSTPTDNNYYVPKKCTKSKPIASSTPDGQNSKSAPLTSSNKKRNFSCDISPVTTYVNTSGSDERKDSPKRMSKLPTPKKCTTPTRQQADAFGVSRFLTPPRNYSSLNTNNLRSPQRLNRSSINFQRYSPASEKNVGKIQQSPLKETNRITKVKPLNLISKIKRHSTSFTEKENYT